MPDQDNNFYLALIVLSVLTGIILGYFILTITRYHKRYVRLQKERMYAEIVTQENERKRITTELQEKLAPLLSEVKSDLSNIELAHAGDQATITRSGRFLDEIIGRVRQISDSLVPATLEKKGLADAVRELVVKINHGRQLNIDLLLVRDLQVPKDKQIHIYRIIEEIVYNTIKHADAKNLQVGMNQEENHLLILTKDDGKGFEQQQQKGRNKGLGLKSLESRTEILNGILNLESKPGQGTGYFIKIPLT